MRIYKYSPVSLRKSGDAAKRALSRMDNRRLDIKYANWIAIVDGVIANKKHYQDIYDDVLVFD